MTVKTNFISILQPSTMYVSGSTKIHFSSNIKPFHFLSVWLKSPTDTRHKISDFLAHTLKYTESPSSTVTCISQLYADMVSFRHLGDLSVTDIFMVSINVCETDNTGAPSGCRSATKAFAAARGEPRPTHKHQVLGLDGFVDRSPCSGSQTT